MSSGLIFDIQKFSVHDGPGIRTTVFMKGCPLRCAWCHNPESWRTRPEILFSPDKCIGCGECISSCPQQCHELANGTHHYGRDACEGCGICASRCFSSALELCGTRQSAESVMKEILKDRPFYEESGGGLTVSGGEPMAQFEFTLALLSMAKQNGIHVCMETCGFADTAKYELILPYVDLFLFDIKTLDSQKHRQLTGQDNSLILKNLRLLDKSGASIHLRCPLVKGVNDSDAELSGISKLAESLNHVREIEIEPFHPLGISKSRRLGMEGTFNAPFTPKEVSDTWVKHIAASTKIPTKKH